MFAADSLTDDPVFLPVCILFHSEKVCMIFFQLDGRLNRRRLGYALNRFAQVTSIDDTQRNRAMCVWDIVPQRVGVTRITMGTDGCYPKMLDHGVITKKR